MTKKKEVIEVNREARIFDYIAGATPFIWVIDADSRRALVEIAMAIPRLQMEIFVYDVVDGLQRLNGDGTTSEYLPSLKGNEDAIRWFRSYNSDRVGCSGPILVILNADLWGAYPGYVQYLTNYCTDIESKNKSIIAVSHNKAGFLMGNYFAEVHTHPISAKEYEAILETMPDVEKYTTKQKQAIVDECTGMNRIHAKNAMAMSYVIGKRVTPAGIRAYKRKIRLV